MMRALYTALLGLALPLIFAHLARRGLREPAYRRGWGQRLGWLPPSARTQTPPLWVHAASVGEVRAIAPLIRQLQTDHPDTPLLLTTTTPAGAEQAAGLLRPEDRQTYLPLDCPGAVARFLDRARPRLAVIVEMELWPNLFAALRRREIPVLLANARMSARSARRYARLRRLIAPVLATPTRILAQAEDDASRLTELGAPAGRVEVAGNLKFDLALPADLAERGAELRASLGARPAWIAASTREGEEESILAAHATVRRTHPDALLLLAPRHPQRFDEVADLIRDHTGEPARRSRGEVPDADQPVYLADTLGELPLLYAAADLAFVGGSLVPLGGQNVLEPAAVGRAVITGPSRYNFATITRGLEAAGALTEVADADALGRTVTELLTDPESRAAMGAAGAELVAAHRGATQRLAAQVAAILKTGAAPREEGG
ncbi:3-deoxy-D-manno-octulosonic-acid transferase [Thiohalospira halophila DSM 15071]|uniref:3-deoxy-D-manno-octulosonic acid transferase n=1 Tax=Thiohalospira halophila DSM 15071 TaxID=1123397 RepID=A0A1I1RR68_9GAMM|nr:lipid IV(A) 3-deoxy-D-manno-octulosonic acid transferase [Thiohalospira halophila]SFD36517.1 3-deoxy-D-manno-octulosonic-acid transferase [Thiohalospira halophila DSM 15071]